MKKVVINICPQCGQINIGLKGSSECLCPVCRNVWKLYPRDKIEVRLS